MTTPTTPRPKRRDPAVIAAAAEKLADAVKPWLLKNGEEFEREKVVEELAEAMLWGGIFGFDGYKLAKELEDDNWTPDEELVEILSSAVFKLHNALAEAETAWLPTSGLTAPALESFARCKQSPNIGQVVRVDLKTGHATLKVEADGHGTLRNGCGTIGYVVPWEELEPV